MSRPRDENLPENAPVPMMVLVYRANRALQNDLVREANSRGHPHIKLAFNSVFATLDENGSRAIDMAAQAGITRQSMGEVIREMVELGFVEMRPDPNDRRAKLVTYTEAGLARAREGLQYILELERLFASEFGDAYEQARQVLVQLTDLLEERADPTVDR